MKSNEVYKITNKITGKIYIGITNQGSGARYRHHWYESRIGEPSPIHKSMAKYGEENFTLEIIDFAETYEELKKKKNSGLKNLIQQIEILDTILQKAEMEHLAERILKKLKKKFVRKRLGEKFQKKLKRKCLKHELANVQINKESI